MAELSVVWAGSLSVTVTVQQVPTGFDEKSALKTYWSAPAS
jgi:hypothetical protein